MFHFPRALPQEKPPMLRPLSFAFAVLVAACSGSEEEATTSASSDELVSCGWLMGGTCEKLPAGNWRSAEFWGELYLDKYSAQLEYANTHIEAGPTPITTQRTVLLITGVTIKKEWMMPIQKRLERDGFSTYLYEPPALLSGDLLKESKALDAIVEKIRKDTGETKIDILAECTGGVIARHYIQSLGGDQKIAHMVTFVSPQHGLPIAPLVHAIVGWPALRDLSPGSTFMHAVNDVPLPTNVKFTSIYTCTDEYIQPYKTSKIPGATNIDLCQGFIGHFQTMYDPSIYLVMHDALMK
jgi:triacylglycerol esterase/lipase EstA (alpha/beta hydrolase family)